MTRTCTMFCSRQDIAPYAPARNLCPQPKNKGRNIFPWLLWCMARLRTLSRSSRCYHLYREGSSLSAHFAPSSQPERDSLQGRRLCLFPLPHFPLSRLHSRTKKMGRWSEDWGMKNIYKVNRRNLFLWQYVLSLLILFLFIKESINVWVTKTVSI